MQNRFRFLNFIIMIGFLLSACGAPASPAIDSEAFIQTSVLQTRAALASDTPPPPAATTPPPTVIQPSPLPSAAPTASPTATATPVRNLVLGQLIDASRPERAFAPESWPAQLQLNMASSPEAERCQTLSELQLSFEPRDYSLPGGKADWCLCGIDAEPGDALVGSLAGPDGATATLTTTLEAGQDEKACFHFTHTFPLDTPRQVHEFRTTVAGLELIDRFIPWAGVFVFDGWQAEEEVEVQVYEPDGDFMGGKQLTADDQGRLVVQVKRPTPEQPLLVVAAGLSGVQIALDPLEQKRLGFQNSDSLVSGDLVDLASDAPFTPIIAGDLFAPTPTDWLTWCSSGVPSRLYVGDIVQALADTPVQPTVRRQPGKNARIMVYLEPGETMQILEGPKCILDMVWWRVVMLDRDVEGWLMEVEERDFYVEPILSPNKPENRRSNP
ncbi:MAG TPA: hypothetical protein VLS48_07605 [Anaerolineales bacterium]|nr:hypothetical protein [Anaerolineales bacterium]